MTISLLTWDKYAQLQFAVISFSLNEHSTLIASQKMITDVAATKKVLTKLSFDILVPMSSVVYLEPIQNTNLEHLQWRFLQK